MPEQKSAATQLASSWEVSTKARCDTLTSMVGASKLMLEESFNARADVMVVSDEDSKVICVPEKWPATQLFSSY